jgi:hypothetical protein
VEEFNDMPVLNSDDTKKNESAGQITQKEKKGTTTQKATHVWAKCPAIPAYTYYVLYIDGSVKTIYMTFQTSSNPTPPSHSITHRV